MLLPIEGDSMLPTLRHGDRVAVEFGPVAAERGALLLYRQADYLVVHRLLGPADHADGSPRLRTRGDGRNELDPPLERERVRGRVFALESGGAWWDLESGGARAWALALALHGLGWSFVGAGARTIDRRVRGASAPRGLAAFVARADRVVLRAAHRAAFRVFHRRLPGQPRGVAAGADVRVEATAILGVYDR